MDAWQLTSTILNPNSRRGSRYNVEDINISDSPPTNENLYNVSRQQQNERISTYNKIVQEMEKDGSDAFDLPSFSILGGGATNAIFPSISPGRNNTNVGGTLGGGATNAIFPSISPGRNNTNVGGTLKLYPSGRTDFCTFNTSVADVLPHRTLQQPSETKDISTRRSPTSVKTYPDLYDLLEKFSIDEDESLCPDMSFNDCLERQIIEAVCLESQINEAAHNQTVDHKEETCPNTVAPLVVPLPIISFPLEASSLKNKVSNTSVLNISEVPEIKVSNPSGINISEVPEFLSKEKVPNIIVSSAADNVNTLELTSRVRSISLSSQISEEDWQILNDLENMSISPIDSMVSPMKRVSKTISLQESVAEISTPKNNSTSNCSIPPTQDHTFSEKLSRFFTGIGSSPTKSLSETSEHIKEVRESNMIWR